MAISDMFEKLFIWKHDFEYNGQKFYQRIVSDAVIEDARRFALVASRTLRKKLRNEDSDDYLIFIDPVHDLTNEDIINVLVYAEGRDVMNEYLRTTPRRIIEKPSDGATLEEQEQYDEALVERDKEYSDDLGKHIDEWEKAYRARTANATREQLIYSYKAVQTDKVCSDLFSEEFEKYVLAHSLYSDDKLTKKAFRYEEYILLPSDVRAYFREQYNSINIGGDEIKN